MPKTKKIYNDTNQNTIKNTKTRKKKKKYSPIIFVEDTDEEIDKLIITYQNNADSNKDNIFNNKISLNIY